MNKGGGMWTLTLKPTDKAVLTKLWVYTVLGLIGHTFDYGSGYVCGGVVSSRKAGDRVCIWTRYRSDSDGAEIIKDVGARMYQMALNECEASPRSISMSYRYPLIIPPRPSMYMHKCTYILHADTDIQMCV